MDIKARVIAINRLLADIYQREMRLSYLLADLKFDREDIKLAGNELIADVVAIFNTSFEVVVSNFRDGQRLYKILHDSYGLTGNSALTLRQLSVEFDVSHERIGQLKQKALKKLKAPQNRSLLEEEFRQKVHKAIASLKNRDISATDDTIDLHTEKKYDFQPSLLANGEECLIISRGNNRIAIARSDFAEFYQDFVVSLQALAWENFQAHSPEKAKQEHTRAYEPWTQEEERILRENLVEGLNIKEIAKLLERNSGAISSRIKKLGLR